MLIVQENHVKDLETILLFTTQPDGNHKKRKEVINFVLVLFIIFILSAVVARGFTLLSSFLFVKNEGETERERARFDCCHCGYDKRPTLNKANMNFFYCSKL